MDDTRAILLDALDDEYRAEASYAAIIARFGDVRPFSAIVHAEQRHSNAIARQLERLGHAVPANPWQGKIDAPATLGEACSLAIAAELENIALYDRLLPRIADPGVRQVLQNLQDASRENHLPAFRRCLERSRDGSRERGRGQGNRYRRGRGRPQSVPGPDEESPDIAVGAFFKSTAGGSQDGPEPLCRQADYPAAAAGHR